MSVYSKVKELVLCVLQPISAMAVKWATRYISDMVKVGIHMCEKCHGSYDINYCIR